MTSTYAINTNNIPLLHGLGRVRYLRDGEIDDRCERISIQVRSGDLFINTASKLDDLSDQLKEADEATFRELQDIIDDLLYLQSQYMIIKKDARYYNGLLGGYNGPINFS